MLKRIGEVCQKTLEQLRKNPQKINENEFIGALKSTELAKQQKKFILRVEANKFGNDKCEIKLSEILNCSEALKKSVNSKDKETWINNIKTPFGSIDIKYFIDKGNNKPNVFIYPNNEHYLHFSYKGMAMALDNYCNKMSLKKEYINQKVNKNTFENNRTNLNAIIQVSSSGVVVDVLTAKNAAVLCGCLLFAESCDVKNLTRGK